MTDNLNLPRRNYADLTDVDRAILRALEHGEGSMLSADLAAEVGVSPQGMGSRLRSLEKRNLIEQHVVLGYLDRPTTYRSWSITQNGIDGGPW